MQLPTFTDVNQSRGYYSEYTIDFSTPEHRKYKEEIHGVRVYENGLVEISPRVWRQPATRSELYEKYRLDFDNPWERRGTTYTTPEGKRVAREWLTRDYYVYDRRHNMVVSAPASFYGGYARLIGQPIEVAEVSRKHLQAFRKKYKDLFDLALTFVEMSSESPRRYSRYYDSRFRALLTKCELPEPDKAIGEHNELLYWLAAVQKEGRLDHLLHQYVRLHYTVPFLYFKDGT